MPHLMVYGVADAILDRNFGYWFLKLVVGVVLPSSEDLLVFICSLGLLVLGMRQFCLEEMFQVGKWD